MADHKTSCPNCKKVFKVKLEMQGKRCRCAKCQTKFVINIDTPLEQVLSPPTSPKTDPVVVEVKEQFQVPLAQEQDTATTPAMASDEIVDVVVTPAPSPSASKPVPAKPTQPSITGGLLDQAAKSSAESGAGARVKSSDGVSPFEELASKLVSAHAAASEHSVYDPRRFMAYSTNANLVSKDSAIEKSTRMVIRGGALMLFAMMMVPLVMLGIHLTGSRWTCPIGGLLAALMGCFGALLTVIGLRSKLGAALLYGVLPGGGFLVVGGLVVLLFMNGYWGSGISLVPDSGFRFGGNRNSNSWDRGNRNRDPFGNNRVTNPNRNRDPFEGINNNRNRDPFQGMPDPFEGMNNNRRRDPFEGINNNRNRDPFQGMHERMNQNLNNNIGGPRSGRRRNPSGIGQ